MKEIVANVIVGGEKRNGRACSSRDEANRGANSLSTERGKEGKKREKERYGRKREVGEGRERKPCPCASPGW